MPINLSQADLDVLWKAFMDRFKITPVEFKFPFVIAKETISIKAYVPPPPVTPPEIPGAPPTRPGVPPKELAPATIPLRVSTIASSIGRELTWTAHQWVKLTYRDVVTGQPVRIRNPTLVAFGEYRDGWIVPPAVTLKEVIITIPDVPDLPDPVIIPKIPKLSAPSFELSFPSFPVLEVPERPSVDIPSIPAFGAAPQIPQTIFQAGVIPALPEIPPVSINYVVPKRTYKCAAMGTSIDIVGQEQWLDADYKCKKDSNFFPAWYLPAAVFGLEIVRPVARMQDWLSGDNLKAQLAEVAKTIDGGMNWMRTETMKHVESTRILINDIIYKSTDLINRNIVGKYIEGKAEKSNPDAVISKINSALLITHDVVDKIAHGGDFVGPDGKLIRWDGFEKALEDRVQWAVDQTWGFFTDTRDAIDAAINGGVFKEVDYPGVQGTINNLSSQLTAYLNDNILSDETKGAIVYEINAQIEAANKQMKIWRDGLGKTLDEFRALTQESVNIALKEVRDRAEWAVNQTVRSIWDLLGLAERTVFSPIQVRNVVEDGFDIQALSKDFRLHYLACGLTA